MTLDHHERVYVTGAREGAYLVEEEQADGSLVLRPDGSPLALRRQVPQDPAEQPGPLALLFRRRPESKRTTDDALEAWGVKLRDDEDAVEFVWAEVCQRRGYLAVTNRRLVFLEAYRSRLVPRYEHPLTQITMVEPLPRGRRAKLTVRLDGAPPMVIGGADRAQTERLRAALLAD